MLHSLLLLLSLSGTAPAGAASRAPQPKAEEAAESKTEVKRQQDQKRWTVEITAGDVAVDELLRFLSDAQGVSVIRVPTASKAAETIRVVAAIKNADYEVVKALLEANGWNIEKKTLSSGRSVLRVRHTSSTTKTGIESRRVFRVPRD